LTAQARRWYTNAMRMVIAVVAVLLPAAAACEGGTQTATVTETTTRTRTVTVTETVSTPQLPAVYVPQPSGQLDYRPQIIGLGATNGISEIHWDAYGGDTAKGAGVLGNPRCTASCPTNEPPTLSIRFELRSIGPCKGVPTYRALRPQH
jgi:hypothetical protein